MPAMVATASALRVTLASVELPITVVIASSSISGLPWASSRAIGVVVAGVAVEDDLLGHPPTLGHAAAAVERSLPSPNADENAEAASRGDVTS